MANIEQNFIPDLPQLEYDRGVGEYIGVLAHSTGTYDVPIENEREYEVNNFNSAFVHFFVNHEKILQVADIRFKAWGAGRAANGKYVHVELCQTKDPEKFEKSYNNYVYVLAFILVKKNLGVYNNRTIVSHEWVSENLGGTDHTDPIAYLEEHGKTWDDLVNDVDAEYKRQKAPIVSTMTIDQAVEFLCAKIKSSDTDYWKKTAKSVQYLDIMVTKIATKWKAENEAREAAGNPVNEVKRIPPLAVTPINALNFIDSKIHLSDMQGWVRKSGTIAYLGHFFTRISYVWLMEQK